MQNFWNIAMVFTGTVIGAGFASGQEIMQFFIKYGNKGIFGIFLSICIFTFLTCIILCKIQKTGASNVEEYLGNDCPVSIRKIYSILSSAFMFVTFCVMVTATGEMFDEHLCLPQWTGEIIMYAICIYCFSKGENGIVGINKLLTPIIILVTIYIFFNEYLLQTRQVFSVSKVFNNIGVSSFVYVSYNTLSLIAILTAVSKLVVNRTTAVLGAVLGGIMLLISALCIWYVLYTKDVSGTKIPMLSAVSENMRFMYIPVLFFAMATTAVSSGVGVINSIKINKKCVIVVMILLSILISKAGFEKLVANVYSLFGYLGFIIGIYTILDGIKYLKHRKQ